MPRPLPTRDLTPEERADLEHLTRSRTGPARQVERARVVLAVLTGERPQQVAAYFHVSLATVYLWLHRFQAAGLVGLEDRPRVGRPPTYPREQVAIVIAAALTAPQTLGLPFSSWTLDRLATYLAEQHGITMKRSRIDELLLAEGLRWRKQETWFGQRVDPEFAAKRGQLSSSTPLPQSEASSSA